jgi:alanyl-tRNA synthetase
VVLRLGDGLGFSVELCGGTHVSATGDIGYFAIVSESGVAAGVRRIEALTGPRAVQSAQEQRAALNRLVAALGVNDDQAVEAVQNLQTEKRRLSREVTQLKTKLAWAAARRTTMAIRSKFRACASQGARSEISAKRASARWPTR